MNTTLKHREKLKGLYAITDATLIPEKNFRQCVEDALQGGCKIIQYRDKSHDLQKKLLQAEMICALCRQYHTVSIINDDIELAKTVAADGVHLGKDDALISHARQTLAKNSIIGVSCYNDFGLAIAAEKNSADYVAFGAMFASTTKPQATKADITIISKAKQNLSIPVCVIGGINHKNLKSLITQGADMAAVIQTLFASDDITDTARQLSKQFQSP